MTDRFIDSHAHLDSADYAPDLAETIARTRQAGITDLICIGASEGYASNPKAIALAEQHDWMFATVGIHPHDASQADAPCLAKIRALAAHPKVVGIGETGLDYHYDHSPRDQQRESFRAHLELARETKLPAVIHTREAEDDTIAILRDLRAQDIGGVIHCFTGTEKLAQAALDVGFSISFSGVLTFKNGDPLRRIAKNLPRDRVLIETDCPFLTPVPLRGKRNEPAYILHTAKVLADLWEAPLDDIKRTTGANAAALFRLPNRSL